MQNKIVVAPVVALETSVEGFNRPLAGFLNALSLPTENVLVAVDERRAVVQAIEMAIQVLPLGEREKSAYLSKFVVAASVGLFDAALNYLWNETISALRRLVTATDLAYFFDVAEKRQEHRKKLATADDLPAVEDATLLDACVRIGLLSDVNRERLRHVNYMRNHASAAHPNQNDLNGAEMISWLSNCLKYAITAKPDVAVLQTKRWLLTIREHAIDVADVPVLESEIRKLPQERIDDLNWTLVGVYTDEKSTTTCRANIDLIAPSAWQAATESRRYEIGARHAEFMKRGEPIRKQLAHDFLKRVNGERYRSDEVLAAELLEKLRALHSAHRSFNNFYNEWPHAEALESSLPQNGLVPKAAVYSWVFSISQCYIGNGMGYRDGTDEQAIPHYEKHIDNFTEREIAEFVKMFAVEEFTVDLSGTKPDHRARVLVTRLLQRSQDVFVKRGLSEILNAPPQTLRRVGATTTFAKNLVQLPVY